VYISYSDKKKKKKKKKKERESLTVAKRYKNASNKTSIS